MSIIRYLKAKDGLPDPSGSLSSSVSSRAITMANKEVRETINAKGKKCGPYNRLVSELLNLVVVTL